MNIILFWDAAPCVCRMCTAAPEEKSTFLWGLYPEDGVTRSPDRQNHSRKNLKSHTLILYLWKLSPMYAVRVMLLRDVWQTMACRQHSHLNLWSVISKDMQHQTLTGGYCTWGYDNTVSQNKRACFAFAVVLFGILLMTQLLIRGQFGGNIK